MVVLVLNPIQYHALQYRHPNGALVYFEELFCRIISTWMWMNMLASPSSLGRQEHHGWSVSWPPYVPIRAHNEKKERNEYYTSILLQTIAAAGRIITDKYSVFFTLMISFIFFLCSSKEAFELKIRKKIDIVISSFWIGGFKNCAFMQFHLCIGTQCSILRPIPIKVSYTLNVIPHRQLG